MTSIPPPKYRLGDLVFFQLWNEADPVVGLVRHVSWIEADSLYEYRVVGATNGDYSPYGYYMVEDRVDLVVRADELMDAI